MTHLTSAELIDAMEGMLIPERAAHLAACGACRRRLDDLSSVLNEAKQVSCPEPSPLFWTHFSHRVRAAVDTEPAESRNAWPSWLRWQVLLPFGTMAMILMALMLAVPRQVATDSSENDVAVMDTPAADSADALEMLVGWLDLETAGAAAVIEPGFVEQAFLELTSEEQQELARLLRAELSREKS